MKTCIRCGESRPESDFYRNGTDSYCKSCRRVINSEGRSRRKERGLASHLPGEPSTQAAMDVLLQHGIPSCPGSAMGRAWIDLIAWGCVPIEAKISLPYRKENTYQWSFTPSEIVRGFEGLFMFFARSSERDRVFIVPSNVDWIQTNGRPNKTAVSVVFNSKRAYAHIAEKLEQYEDRFDLVEQYRLEWVANH